MVVTVDSAKREDHPYETRKTFYGPTKDVSKTKTRVRRVLCPSIVDTMFNIVSDPLSSTGLKRHLSVSVFGSLSISHLNDNLVEMCLKILSRCKYMVMRICFVVHTTTELFRSHGMYFTIVYSELI